MTEFLIFLFGIYRNPLNRSNFSYNLYNDSRNNRMNRSLVEHRKDSIFSSSWINNAIELKSTFDQSRSKSFYGERTVNRNVSNWFTISMSDNSWSIDKQDEPKHQTLEVIEKKADKKIKQKSYKKTMKTYNWRNTLRNEDDQINKKLLSKFVVNRINLSNKDIRNILEDLYRIFINKNTENYITYQEYFDKLVDIGIISDNPNKTLSQTNRIIMPIFVPKLNQLIFKTGNRYDFEEYDESSKENMDESFSWYQNETNYDNISINCSKLEPAMNSQCLSIYNNIIENLVTVLDKHNIKINKSKSRSKSKQKSGLSINKQEISPYDNIITSTKMQRNIVFHKDIAWLMTCRLSTYSSLYLKYFKSQL